MWLLPWFGHYETTSCLEDVFVYPLEHYYGVDWKQLIVVYLLLGRAALLKLKH